MSTACGVARATESRRYNSKTEARTWERRQSSDATRAKKNPTVQERTQESERKVKIAKEMPRQRERSKTARDACEGTPDPSPH